MKYTGKWIILTILAVLGSLALSACGAKTPVPTPTLSVEAIQTAAVGTFAAGLTQTALALPTDTPTLTPTFTSTSGTPLAIGSGATPTVSCYGLTLVSDVTIPDNTPMVPGQTFTKTWLVKNTGTCTWDTGFKFIFTVGDSMGGVPLVLNTPVSPGADLEISIAMTAPNKTGKLVGHWRMSTASGTQFGADIYVAIILSPASATTTPATATATATAGTATATATPTETPTQ